MEIQKKAIKNSSLDQIKDIILGEKSSDVLLNDDGSEELLSKNHVITEKDIKKPFLLIFCLTSLLKMKNCLRSWQVLLMTARTVQELWKHFIKRELTDFMPEMN